MKTITDDEFQSLVIQVKHDLRGSDIAINKMIMHNQIQELIKAFDTLGKEVLEKAIERAKEFSDAVEIVPGISISAHTHNVFEGFLSRIRFVIADILNMSDRYCWTDLVEWAMFGKELSKNGNECRKESFEDGTCYCGKFCHGKQMRKGASYKTKI